LVFVKVATAFCAVLVGGLFGGLASPISNAATTATKQAATTVSSSVDRLRPDVTKLSPAILVRRAIGARVTSKVTGTMSFVTGSKVSATYLLDGAIDFDLAQSDILLTIDKSKKHYLLVDDVAYIEVGADLSESVDGKWISSPLTRTPRPEGVAVLDITISSVNLVGTTKSWKEISTASDKKQGIRRLKGVGTKDSFATIDVDRFLDQVLVEVAVSKAGSLAQVTWQLVPKPEETDAEEIRLSTMFAPTKRISVTAPVDAVVTYDSIRSA
jgi:hypothetical protein